MTNACVSRKTSCAAAGNKRYLMNDALFLPVKWRGGRPWMYCGRVRPERSVCFAVDSPYKAGKPKESPSLLHHKRPAIIMK